MARGGGVAEMPHTLASYAAGAGVDIRWLVVDGDPAFVDVTKRIHNRAPPWDAPPTSGSVTATSPTGT